MKSGIMFWGSFLIFLGIFILLNNLNLFGIQIDEIITFWPILLIIWGIALLNVPKLIKLILASLSGVLLALIIVAGFYSTGRAIDKFEFIDDKINKHDYKNMKTYNLNYDSTIKFINLNFSGGASSFKFTSTNLDSNLLKSINDDMFVESELLDDSTLDINISGGSDEVKLNGTEKRYSEILLNTKPVWNFNVNSGASKLVMDLKDLAARELNFDVGAAKIELTLGQISDTTDVQINAGAAKFVINIPKEINCNIQTNSAMTTNSFDGFKNEGDGFYILKSDNQKAKFIRIDFEGALSSFKVKKY